jgi:hypothetical protein
MACYRDRFTFTLPSVVIATAGETLSFTCVRTIGIGLPGHEAAALTTTPQRSANHNTETARLQKPFTQHKSITVQSIHHAESERTNSNKVRERPKVRLWRSGDLQTLLTQNNDSVTCYQILY